MDRDRDVGQRATGSALVERQQHRAGRAPPRRRRSGSAGRPARRGRPAPARGRPARSSPPRRRRGCSASRSVLSRPGVSIVKKSIADQPDAALDQQLGALGGEPDPGARAPRCPAGRGRRVGRLQQHPLLLAETGRDQVGGGDLGLDAGQVEDAGGADQKLERQRVDRRAVVVGVQRRLDVGAGVGAHVPAADVARIAVGSMRSTKRISGWRPGCSIPWKTGTEMSIAVTGGSFWILDYQLWIQSSRSGAPDTVSVNFLVWLLIVWKPDRQVQGEEQSV